MALRKQPYLPLYVNDFLSDEKLGECSAESTGVYIRLLCIMHKSDEYGVINLKAKDKITNKSIANFSRKLFRLMPYDIEVIQRSLEELLSEGVIKTEGDKLWQPRMVKDGGISEARSKAGSAGGKAVKNIATKRNYNEKGYLYIAEDCDNENCHKVGISKDPKTRLQQLRSKSQRNLKLARVIEVDDMGTVEDSVLCQLQEIRDGEWIYDAPLSVIENAVNSVLSKSKSKANPEIENEYENESEIGLKRENVDTEKDKTFDTFWEAYPRKSGGDVREACIEYMKAIDAGADPKEMIAAAKALEARTDRESFRFLPAAEKWLRNKGWLEKADFPEPEKRTKPQEQRIRAFTPLEERQPAYDLSKYVEWPPGSNNYVHEDELERLRADGKA